MVMTAGGKGGSSGVRKREQEESAKQLRAEKDFLGRGMRTRRFRWDAN